MTDTYFYFMKKIALLIIGLMTIFSCQELKEQQNSGYIVQVSLGSWHSPDYTAEQIIERIDTISKMIPIQKVIIGWSDNKELRLRKCVRTALQLIFGERCLPTTISLQAKASALIVLPIRRTLLT